MSSIGTIYGPANVPKVLRARAVAAVNGLTLDVQEVNVMQGENQKPEFLEKFPLGKVPGFQSSEGLLLTEGRAITRYIAGISSNANLLGSDNKSAAEIEQCEYMRAGEDVGSCVTLCSPTSPPRSSQGRRSPTRRSSAPLCASST